MNTKIDTEPGKDEFEKHRLLWITKDASEQVVNGCLRKVGDLQRKRSKNGTGRFLPGWGNGASAFNDSKLAGGGFQKIHEQLVVCQAFCTNENIEHGKPECGRSLPPDHEGPCECGAKVYKLMPDGTKSFLNVDYYFRLGKYYQLLVENTDLPQRIVDYYPEAIAQLSVPLDDPNHRVHSIVGGWVARSDYQKNQHRFVLDVIPKVGEIAMHDLGPAFNNELVPAKVLGETECQYTVRHPGDNSEHSVNKEDVQKVNGTLPLIVIVAEDGAEIYGDMQYSNMGKVELFVNIHEKHRHREEFVVPFSISAGGVKHYNGSHRGIFQAKQARILANEGTPVGPFTVWMGNRKVTVHSATLYRSEICKVMDNPEVASACGVMDQRNIFSLSPFLKGYTAHPLQRKALYTFLLNRDAEPRDKESSDAGFEEAHMKLGSPDWEAYAKATGFKFKPVQWAGYGDDVRSDPDQSNWLRVEHEKLHALGIVVKNMRRFLLSLVPPKRRALLAFQPQMIRQPPGSHPIHPLVKISKKDGKISINGAGEKLHQKKDWVRQRMLFDLLPMFENDEPVRQVLCALSQELFV